MQILVNKLQVVVVYSEVDESDCCISHPGLPVIHCFR